MRVKPSFMLIASTILAALLTSPAAGGSFDLSWHTVDCGGGASTGGSFRLTGTIGQHDAQSAPGAMTGGSFSLTGGFWAATTIAAAPCPADFDHSGAVNGLDLAMLLAQWSGPATYAPCPPFRPQDLNQDCRVNGLDLASLLAAWGTCP